MATPLDHSLNSPFAKAIWKQRDVKDFFSMALPPRKGEKKSEEKKRKKEEDRSEFMTIFPGGRVLHMSLDEGFLVSSADLDEETQEVIVRLKKGKNAREITPIEATFWRQPCMGCSFGCVECEVFPVF